MVITDARPSDEALAEILQPWHEYECTGVDDQYVVDVDVTDEVMSSWAETTEVVKLADGTMKSRYAAEFYVEEGTGWDKKRTFVQPAGTEIVTISRCELAAIEGETLAEWAKDYHGYVMNAEGRFIRRTNPNRKWDWWVIGGRWSGLLKMKVGIKPLRGRPGAFGNEPEAGHGDMAMLSEIDIDGMRTAAAERAGELWDKARAAAADCEIPLSWDKVREAGPTIEEARTAYWAQPAIVAIKSAFPEQFDIDEEIAALSVSREEACAAAADGALTTYAVVKDGKWYEKGQMGWFGMSHGEMSQSDWNRQTAELLAGLAPTTWLTIVDCHI